MLQRAHVRVTVVDIQALSFVIARRYFSMPETVRCVRRDGIAFLRTSSKTFDAIIVDVFAANNKVPKNFTTLKFFEMVQRKLAGDGIMVMNVMVKHDADKSAEIIARRAKATGKPITLLDWPREKDRNALIVAGDTKNVRIPSRIAPKWIKSELQKIIKRTNP
jgi:spermidine synthase